MVQLTTDGLRLYVHAVENAFHGDIDYAQLHKIYAAPTAFDDERRYSPAVCTGIDVRKVNGDPDLDKASTSYVERQNLTMRMGMRRFTRLTNGFSKKVENLAHAVSLHYMYYNFARPHTTLTKDAGGRPHARDGCGHRKPRLDSPRHRRTTRLTEIRQPPVKQFSVEFYGLS